MNKIRPSQFVEHFINLSSSKPFRFTGREYFRPIYDSDATLELFKTGRQCAKSTYLCNRIVTRASTIRGLQALYVAPKSEQSKMFSRQKIDPAISYSPRLKPFLKLSAGGSVISKNILNFYCFLSGSYVKLSTTYNGVDRDRGISINDLYVDEVQDQLSNDIDILKEGQSAADVKYLCYAGTPKSMGNYIERLWQDSKQIVWMMRCGGCNTWQLPNIEDNIKETGLLCKKCGKRLEVLNGEWVSLNSKGKYNGWHISQLMRLVNGMPGRLEWKTDEGIHGIWDKFTTLEPERFNNEVLGFSFDSATNPLTYQEIKDCSFENLKKQEKNDTTFFSNLVVMGIDWGCNTNNFTVVSISIVYNDKPTVIYMERFTGAESDPYVTARKIKDIWNRFECKVAFCDNGLFFHYEQPMRSVFGNRIINEKFNFIYYYLNEEKLIEKSKRIHDRHLFKVCRNDIMSLYINSIKKKLVGFYNFEQFSDAKFHTDYLSVGYEIRHSKDKGERLFFLSSKDTAMPTDAFHSGLYSWLGVMMHSGKIQWYYENQKKVGMSSLSPQQVF